MSGYFTVLVSFGILSPFFLAIGAVQCSEKEALLEPMSNTEIQVTGCLIACTEMTYLKKIQLQDNHNIRLRDSTEGNLGEYCWSTELGCIIGESFQHAYVVLPVDISAIGHEQLEVRSAETTLHIHNSPTTVADNCGLRYDATQHFITKQTGTSFCVQVVTRQDAVGGIVLKCHPFLVTLWQRDPNQSKQGGGG